MTARAPVRRTVKTLVGAVHLERPSCYWPACHVGLYPLDAALGLLPGRLHRDGQKATAKLVPAVPDDEAQQLFGDWTGIGLGSERLHTFTKHVVEGLTVLDVAPSRDEIARRVAEVAAGRFRRPLLVLGIDGAFVPTPPASAREHRPGRRGKRAKRAVGRGQWHDAKGLRFSRLAGDRIVHLLRGHQVQNEEQRGEALKQIKEAGLMPEASVRWCVVSDGAEWIWKHVQALFPQAYQGLDDDPCAAYLHNMAKAHSGMSWQAQEWVEATLTRLCMDKMGAVLAGLQRLRPTSDEAAKVIANCWASLHEHWGRTHYHKLCRGG